MPSKSKIKGNSWERECCDTLSKIYGVNFQRVPNSGAYLGQKNIYRKSALTPEQELLAAGDIILPRFLSHITLECKFYKEFSFDSLLSGNKQLNGWIEQARVGEKIPFVLIKVNRKGGFIVIPEDAALMLSVDADTNYVSYNMVSETGDISSKSRYRVYKMEGFFEKYKRAIVAISEENYKIFSDAFPAS